MSEVIPDLKRRDYDPYIVIALNGSNDATQHVAHTSVEAHAGVVSAQVITGKGRGRAIQEVCAKENAEMYAYIDVDLPIPLNEFWRVLEPVMNQRADIALGKRAGKRPLLRRIMTRGFRLLNTVTSGVSVQDAQCGVKAWTAEVARTFITQCTEKGFFFDTELLARVQQAQKRIQEVSMEWIDTRFDGRKSSVRPFSDSLRALCATVRILVNTQGYWGYTLVALCILSLCYVGQYVYAHTYLQPENFLVAHHLANFALPLVYSMFGIVLFYVMYGVVISFARISSVHARALIVLSVVCAVLIACVTLTMHPTRSQDVYWNLVLSRGATEFQLNPYTTTPDTIPLTTWSEPVRDWRWLPMTHGPVWVTMLHVVTSFTDDLAVALVLLRLFFITALCSTFYAAYRILERVCTDLVRRARVFSLLILNPLWFQMGLIDLHNDVFIACAIVWACYALLQKKYHLSIIALVIGGLIKYTPWMLLPVPLYYAWSERKSVTAYLKTYLPILCASAIGVTLICAYFGLLSGAPIGLSNEIIERGTQQYSLFGTLLLQKMFPHAENIMKGVVYVSACIALIIAMIKRKTLLAFTLPFCIIFVCGTSWFQVWYVLWIFALLVPLLPLSVTLLLTIMLFPMGDVLYPNSSVVFLVLACIVYGALWFVKKYILIPLRA